MRVAICFSGMPRNFKSVFDSHKKYVFDVLKDNGFDYDIFIHTWDNKVHYAKYMPDEGNINEIVDLYKPVSYRQDVYDKNKMDELYFSSKIDKYREHIETKGFTEWQKRQNDISDWWGGGLLTHNTTSLFHGLREVNNLRKKYESENNFKYDIIIKTRFDNMIFDKLNVKTLCNESNSVFCPLGYEPVKDLPVEKFADADVVMKKRESLGTVNDIFAVGSRDAMNKYMTLYDRFYDLLIKRFNSGHPRPWHTLGLTKHNLIENKVDIKLFYLAHIVTRRIQKYKVFDSVVCGEGWNIPIKKTDKILLDSNNIGG